MREFISEHKLVVYKNKCVCMWKSDVVDTRDIVGNYLTYTPELLKWFKLWLHFA